MTRRAVSFACTVLAGCNAIFGVDNLQPSDRFEVVASATEAASSTAQAGGAMTTVGTGGSGLGTACEICGAVVPGCQVERDACMASAECAALSTCLDGCDDSVCKTACLKDHGAGMSALYARYDCERCGPACAAVCQDECAGCGGTTCNRCAGSQCAEQSCPGLWNACTTNTDCVALALCINNCMGDQSCEDQCANQHPQGAMAYFDLILCVGCSWDTCYDACDGSTNCAL